MVYPIFKFGLLPKKAYREAPQLASCLMMESTPSIKNSLKVLDDYYVESIVILKERG